MKQLKIGDSVKICENSDFYGECTPENPRDMLGTVIGTNLKSSLIYEVRWKNGAENVYGLEDLELIEEINNYEIY